MGKGRRAEMRLYNDISRNTTDTVHANVSDHSGNADSSFSDIEVYFLDHVDGVKRLCGAFTEIKKRQAASGKRCIVMAGSSDGDSGLDELEHLIEETPIWGKAWIIIKFDHRRPIVLGAKRLHGALIDEISSDGPPLFDARLTPSDNISMRKPTLDEWESSAAADPDWKVILEEIGVSEQLIEPTEVEA